MPAPNGLIIESLRGPALTAALGEVARLRIEVFRAWPYLYDGSIEYERTYLAEFATARDAIIIVARDCDTIVGVATAAPLAGHTAEFVSLFEKQGYDTARMFYCGESVLLPAYRGRGIGHAFFDRREAHARACSGPAGSYTHVAFCAVVRSPADPRTPSTYRPLDDFWSKRGYAPVSGLVGRYSWREIGDIAESEKCMQFWMKPL